MAFKKVQMKKCFINGISAISAQNTFESDFLDSAVVNQTTTTLSAIEPDYKTFIPPAAIRRMAKGIKMGVATSVQALQKAELEQIDAIITGTGMGCSQDSEKFLKSILDNNEQFLTPTSFIQSTHNTVAAQIALRLSCKGYNFTYVNGAVSFESALLDGCMQITSEEAKSILVGGIDEYAEHTFSLYKLIGLIKNEQDKPFSVLNSKSKGTVFSEGATFFALENIRKDSTYAEVVDVQIKNKISKEKLPDFFDAFLKKNNLNTSEIDVVVLGNNGDMEFDCYFEKVSNYLPDSVQVYYKHLSGEYNTASAFGLWVAANMLKKQQIPEVIRLNSVEKQQYKTILLYNQYRGLDHSLVLLRGVL